MKRRPNREAPLLVRRSRSRANMSGAGCHSDRRSRPRSVQCEARASRNTARASRRLAGDESCEILVDKRQESFPVIPGEPRGFLGRAKLLHIAVQIANERREASGDLRRVHGPSSTCLKTTTGRVRHASTPVRGVGCKLCAEKPESVEEFCNDSMTGAVIRLRLMRSRGSSFDDRPFVALTGQRPCRCESLVPPPPTRPRIAG
jgi:hypothetical protein